MISVTEARDLIASILKPVATEMVPLHDAGGRVLAKPVSAKRAQPPFPASAMDGYAARKQDAAAGGALRIIGESAAGRRFAGTLGPGECVRIFTGAPVPLGADIVIMQEDVSRSGEHITLAASRDGSAFIRRAGSDFDAGETFKAPRRLGPSDIAFLASMDTSQLTVYRRPVIALIATGDELVMPGGNPGPDQILSSNNFGMKALLDAHGAECRMLPIAGDSAESLNAVLDLCDGADLIVTLGGASVGEHDLVKDVLLARGLDLSFHNIAMRPGKPLMAGALGNTALIGLPGNPVSTMVCGTVFVVPALSALQGLPMGPPKAEQARLAGPLSQNGPREHYMRAMTNQAEDGLEIAAMNRQDSALLSVLARANALLVRPAHDTARKAGEFVPFISI